jgi:hypothetical protein
MRIVITKRFFGGFSIGNSTLCGTGLIAGVTFGYFTVWLDLEAIPVMFLKMIG